MRQKLLLEMLFFSFLSAFSSRFIMLLIVFYLGFQMSERTWQDKVATWSEQGFSASEIVHKCLQIGKRVSFSLLALSISRTLSPHSMFLLSDLSVIEV